MFDGRQKANYDELTQRTELAKKEGRGTPTATVKQSLSATVTDNDSLYAYNDIYIDVRTPHDEKRGLITIFLGGGMAGVCYWCVKFLFLFAAWIRDGQDEGGNVLNGYAYAFMVLVALLFALIFFFFFKYVYRFLRLEAFTARRLIVRFNRVTRKVYLLRPKNIGGIVALDWEKTEAAVDRSMLREVLPGGGFLALGWDKGAVYDANGRPKDDFDMVFVGRSGLPGAELLAFWEYIRRYMEIGPQAAPPPKKLLSKIPWPWLSFQAAWNILPLRGLRDSGLWGAFVPIKLMLLAVTIIHTAGHWISLLLCYEPKFPSAIEKAGQ
ncbi:MAG TPA: hypothetical protein VME63_08380 [Dyella sp.]|uniref:hypothetical protein n=1 Tax=Dyella sp. TaxID=1869338 RepID=UPI002CDE0773|nr:hypothetical protein [Dyella sp.]HTV85408.1 hypothetical protein [Dyella sp.]